MPAPPSGPNRSVRPVDAASLVMVRGRGAGAEVLMGRRRPGAAFLPGVYVFPGGRLDAADRRPPPGLRLRHALERKLTQRCRSARPLALALAAIRETFEETGLLLAAPRAGGGPPLPRDAPLWRAFARDGAGPALRALDYIARAITPPRSPLRFNTRFFIADARHARGELLRDGELLDLHWVPMREVERRLDVVYVTRFVLELAAAHLAASPRQRAGRRVPLLGHVNDVRRVIEE